MIADVSSNREIGLLNVGAALGANRPFDVALSHDEPYQPRYLGRTRVWRYASPVDLLRVVHKIATIYRRTVYNDTVTVA